jgi:hypothetical protein
MFNSLNKFLGRSSPHKGSPMILEIPGAPLVSSAMSSQRPQTFSKVFRWRLPDGHTREPASVGIAGSFTHWQEVPLKRDSALDAWHATIHHIPGNRTHHYMLLVDGKPVHDKDCDGLAAPHGPHEERFQITTDRGPRVYMLFAQTK